jgi:hypothetical protein
MSLGKRIYYKSDTKKVKYLTLWFTIFDSILIASFDDSSAIDKGGHAITA